MKSSCKKMKFSCSSLDLPNKDKKKCRKGDRLMVGKKVFCLKKKPSVTVQGKAAKKGLKVMFMTDKKKFGGGAQCTAECIQGVTTTTPSTTAGRVESGGTRRFTDLKSVEVLLEGRPL